MDAPGPVATREALKDIMRFWLGMGCDGFRVDMAGSLVKLDEDGKFGTEPDFAYKLPDGFGPRHCAYSPDGKYCYVCGEYSNHVAAFAYGDGKLELIEIYNAVPDDFDGVTYCGGLRFTQDGRYLLVGNRGHNTIAVFTALEGGKLGKVKWFDIMGCWPREFALTPDEKFVVVANQRSNTLDVLSFDKETGDMAPVSSFDYYQPAAVLFS